MPSTSREFARGSRAHTCPPAPKGYSLPPRCSADPTSCGQQQQTRELAVARSSRCGRCCHRRCLGAADSHERPYEAEGTRERPDQAERPRREHARRPAACSTLALPRATKQLPPGSPPSRGRIVAVLPESVCVCARLLPGLLRQTEGQAVVTESLACCSERQRACRVRERERERETSFRRSPGRSVKSKFLQVLSCLSP